MEKMENDELLRTVEALKKAYKKEKEKFEWVENDYEESLIVEEMDRIKTKIKDLKKKIEKGESGSVV